MEINSTESDVPRVAVGAPALPGTGADVPDAEPTPGLVSEVKKETEPAAKTESAGKKKIKPLPAGNAKINSTPGKPKKPKKPKTLKQLAAQSLRNLTAKRKRAERAALKAAEKAKQPKKEPKKKRKRATKAKKQPTGGSTKKAKIEPDRPVIVPVKVEDIENKKEGTGKSLVAPIYNTETKDTCLSTKK